MLISRVLRRGAESGSTTRTKRIKHFPPPHGANAKGTVLGPDLTTKSWMWSDGSYAGIAKTISGGVPQPKKFRSPMPPMGGAQLTPDQVNAVAADIWSLSH